MFGMVLTGLSFGGMFFAVLDTVEARLTLIIVMAACRVGCWLWRHHWTGTGRCHDTMNIKPVSARKVYTVWNFTYKSALGFMLLLTGFARSSSFVPNQPGHDRTADYGLAVRDLAFGLLRHWCCAV